MTTGPLPTYIVDRDLGDENDFDVYRVLGRGDRQLGKSLASMSLYTIPLDGLIGRRISVHRP